MMDGKFSVSTRVLDHIHGQRMRMKFVAILADYCNTIENHSAYSESARCKGREFVLPGVSKKRTTYIPETPSPSLCCEASELVQVVIPGEWLWDRYEKWDAYCVENDLPNKLDLDGRTEMGAPQHAILNEIELPVTTETERFTEKGVGLKVYTMNRTYHNLSNLSKKARRQAMVEGERLVEIDISSCFVSLLASEIRDAEARERVVAELHAGWYQQFEECFEEHMQDLSKACMAYRDKNGQWWKRHKPQGGKERAKGDKKVSVKTEFQRQVLFYLDHRESSCPMRSVVKKLYPELHAKITEMRWKLDASQFAKVLMRAEQTMMIEGCLCQLAKAGINSLGNHDGLIVKASDAARAVRIVESHTTYFLGFTPKVSCK